MSDSEVSTTITGTPRFIALVKYIVKCHAERDTRWFKFHLRGGEPDASLERAENIPIDRLMDAAR